MLRRRYFPESDRYRLIGASALPADWLAQVPVHEHVLVVAEGLTMYLSHQDMRDLMAALQRRFPHVTFLFDAYGKRAARLSALKNPVNAVKARIDFAMDDASELLQDTHGMEAVLTTEIITPAAVERLKGRDRMRFRFMEKCGKRLYRIYGYRIEKR